MTSAPKKTTQNNQIAPFFGKTESLPIALMRAREAVMGYFRPKHREQGMTDPQWRTLRVLHRDGDMEVTELARRAVLMAPSLSRILRGFEERGLIAREAVAGDQRRSLVRLTKAGAKRLAAGENEVNSIYNEILHRYGHKRMHELLTLLRQLEEALTDSDEPTDASK